MPPPLWLVLFPLTVPRNRGGAVSRFRPRSIVLRGQVDEFIEFRDCPWLAGTRANPGGAFRLRLRQVVQGPTFLRVALVGISSGFVLISLDASSASQSALSRSLSLQRAALSGLILVSAAEGAGGSRFEPSSNLKSGSIRLSKPFELGSRLSVLGSKIEGRASLQRLP
jgi:hypothetical protein